MYFSWSKYHHHGAGDFYLSRFAWPEKAMPVAKRINWLDCRAKSKGLTLGVWRGEGVMWRAYSCYCNMEIQLYIWHTATVMAPERADDWYVTRHLFTDTGFPPCVTMGRYSSVGRATRYGMEGPWIESWWGRRNFPQPSRSALGLTQPPV